MPSSKLAVLCPYNGADPLMRDICRINQARYCHEHGYEYLPVKSRVANEWAGFYEVMRHLPDYGKIALFDPDIFILNKKLKLDECCTSDITTVVDRYGIDVNLVLFKNTVWCNDFLADFWKQRNTYQVRFGSCRLAFAMNLPLWTRTKWDIVRNVSISEDCKESFGLIPQKEFLPKFQEVSGPEESIRIVLSNHSFTTETLAHTDILSCAPEPIEYFVVSTKPLPENVDQILVPATRHGMGALFGVMAAVKEAHRRCWKTFIYRNGDDWLFNWDFVKKNWAKFHEGNYKFAGYNWFGQNSLGDFAVNENFIDVETFHRDIDAWWNRFRNRTEWPEGPFAEWVWSRIQQHEFMRLEGREAPGGVGNMHVSDGTNCRAFNRDWGLITAHEVEWRWHYYNEYVYPYRAVLEKKPFFRAWLKESYAQRGVLFPEEQ
jgi:hypothetical protein